MENQKSEVLVAEQNVEVAVYGANLPAQRGFSMPSNYKLPSKAEQFVKIKTGESLLRVISESLVEGYEIFGSDNRPVRKQVFRDANGDIEKSCYFSQKEIDALELKPNKDGKIEQPKYFWALKVWSYELKRIQVWVITQATIQTKLKNIFSDADYADCSKYDLKITKTGSTINDTKYEIMAKKETELPAEFWENVRLTTCVVDAIFEGKYPMEY